MSTREGRAEKAAAGTPRRLALRPLVGAAVAAGAWVALVLLAVRLGRASSWLLAVPVMVAAVGCLLVLFALLGRARAALRGRAAPRRVPGRRKR